MPLQSDVCADWSTIVHSETVNVLVIYSYKLDFQMYILLKLFLFVC